MKAKIMVDKGHHNGEMEIELNNFTTIRKRLWLMKRIWVMLFK